MSTLFISDVHLDGARPQAGERFVALLEARGAGIDALYLLGDLVEYWLGDDQPPGPLAGAFASIARVAREAPAYFMHGNRDFLVGEDFARRHGLTLLPDPTLVDLYGTPTLLMHGDTLCTDDVDYQAFRRQVRDPAWQADFLARPLDEREAIARRVRESSREAMAGKTETLMDVNAQAVARAFDEHGATRLIHGHTHRPAIHREGNRERIVLGDWYEGGSYVVCDESGCRLCFIDTVPPLR